MHKKKSLFLSTLFAALIGSPLFAAEQGALSVSPAVVTLRGSAGQSTTQRLTFTNGTSRSLDFEMKAKDVIVRDGKRAFVEAGMLPGSIAATAVFSQKKVTVASNETVHVDVTVTIPANASARAIVAQFRSTSKMQTAGMQLTASVGTLLTFSLEGDSVEAELLPLAVKPPTATANLTAVQHVANRGMEPILLHGMLAILNSAGTLVGKEALPGWRLLPGEAVDVRVEYGGNLEAGSYRALMTYDLTSKTLTSTADFIVQ